MRHSQNIPLSPLHHIGVVIVVFGVPLITLSDLSQDCAGARKLQLGLVTQILIVSGKLTLLCTTIGREARSDTALIKHARTKANFQVAATGDLDKLTYRQTRPRPILIGRGMREHLTNHLVADRRTP